MAPSSAKKQARRDERLGRRRRGSRQGLPAIGLEAEFATIVDGVPQRPEDVFGSPRAIVKGPLMHRTGRSYHLPTGGAVYFDTGVIELATPLIEIERGCGARGARSLWESLAFLRSELDGILGIGPRRRRLLLQRFGSLTGVRRATREELEPVVGSKAAEAVLRFFAG